MSSSLSVFRLLFKTSLKKYGFCGVHIQKTEYAKFIYSKFAINNFLAWPHIFVFISILLNKDLNILFMPNKLVTQSAHGADVLFWPTDSFTFHELKKTFMFIEFAFYSKEKFDFGIYFIYFIRHLYSPYFLGLLVTWRLYSFNEFKKNIFRLLSNFKKKYKRKKFQFKFLLNFSLVPLFIISFLIFLIPSKIYRYLVPKNIMKKIDYLNFKQKNLDKCKNGELRRV